MKRPALKKSSTEQQKHHLAIGEQNLKIYLRVKPPVTYDPNQQILKMTGPNKVEIASPYYSVNQIDKLYTYEEVFDHAVDNAQVFQRTMIHPVTNALQGYNSTVFIYGMTGSGKTYTMFGSMGSTTHRARTEEEGLVSMTIDYLFSQIQKQPHIRSQIIVSFYEIYNENIRDLLQEDQQPLTIMEDPVRGVFINGLTEVQGEQKNQVKDVIHSGIERRSMNATRSNEVSSRSHAVLQFLVKRYVPTENQTSMLESKFFMIDLAGNQKTSNNESRRFIEGVNINKSLLTLGKCLSILAERKGAYVPFRDSKLTRILKESLGGNSKTVMIACVSSQKKFYEETLNTLKYSTIAKKIKNKGVKHNLKLISKQEVPEPRNFINGKPEPIIPQSDAKIKQLIETFLIAAEAKLKIERLQQDLQQSRKQNEELLNSENCDMETCRTNIKKINDTLNQLIKPYEKQLEKVANAYDLLMESINQYRKSSIAQCENANQIARLRQIINEQAQKIKDYENKASTYSQINMVESDLRDSLSVQSPALGLSNIREITLNSPQIQKNSIFLHSVSQTNRSQSKPKKLTINCGESENMCSSSNLNTSNLSSKCKPEKKYDKYQREIVINLNDDQLDRRSQHSSSKEDFVRRLKETEKKAKGAPSQEISCILKEHETNKYELGNAEMSMIRKLRYFQREKSLEKSNSLGRLLPKAQQPIRFNYKKY